MNSDLSPDSYLQKGSTSVVNGPHKRMQIALLIPLDIMLNERSILVHFKKSIS